MQIIEMTERELAQVSALEQEIFSVPWSEQGFRDTLAMDNVLFFVAKDKETVCGYCGIYLAADEGEITNVAVSPKYRKEGIGECLVRQMIETASKQGAKQFVLEVRSSNEPAICLYEKLGFQKCGVRRNFYTLPTEDANVMILSQ